MDSSECVVDFVFCGQHGSCVPSLTGLDHWLFIPALPCRAFTFRAFGTGAVMLKLLEQTRCSGLG